MDRSELLREALRRHLDRLASEGDADRWNAQPLDDGEHALADIADWGPAEDWSDWVNDAARWDLVRGNARWDRPVLVLTRDPVADRIDAVVVAALSRTRRGLVSELHLTTEDGVPTDSVVNFDNIHTIRRETFRQKVTSLPPTRMAEACRVLQAATGC